MQQAITQILSTVNERHFSSYCCSFWPKRNQHLALKKHKVIITEGYNFAVDKDLEKLFDSVHQSMLIEMLSKTIIDGRFISLIHKLFKAGVAVRHKLAGVPQGGPLSLLLSNIWLWLFFPQVIEQSAIYELKFFILFMEGI